MGEPNPPCIKQQSPFINFQSPRTPSVDTSVLTTTTTTTTESPFFILPASGSPCPENIFVNNNIGFIYNQPPLDNPIVYYTCHSSFNVPNPCVIESSKYIKVADIVVDADSCKSYKLILSDVT